MTQTPQAPEPEGARALRLLHIEDNPADALLMQEYLRQSTPLPGYPAIDFDVAERLGDLTPSRAEAADCAILDLSLPDATGLEALTTLRAMCEDLPIIVLTGFDDLDVGLSALHYGADDYLVKGQVDGFTLERAVRYAIARRRVTQNVAAAAAAATVDTATVIMLAARQAEALRTSEAASRGEGEPPASVAVALGTHEVSVHIDAKDGEYVLHCRSCGWEAARGAKDLHSWTDRSLDWILLRHVAFGDLPDAAAVLPTPALHVADASDVPEPEIPRHALVSPHGWMRPKSHAGARIEG